MKSISLIGMFLVLSLLGSFPSGEQAHAAAPTLKLADVQQIVQDELARIQNNANFDADSEMYQPYYVPVFANIDGTMFTVTRINASVGDFAAGVNIQDTDTGEPYCVTVSSGNVVAVGGDC